MKVTFLDHQSGVELHPEDWHGELPELDDGYTVDGSMFHVVNVDRVIPRDGEPYCLVSLHIYNHPAPMADDKKLSNPKDAIGISKAPMSVVPGPFLHALGLALMEGALKYGRHNYRTAGIRYSVYYDAAVRHLTAWWEGEDIDPDSGLPHPVKAAACMAILFDAMLRENGTDDRPPKTPDGWMAAMNNHAKSLLERFPDPLPPHTELDQ